MPKNIELPDGRIVEFPDTMDDGAISGILSKQFPSTPTPIAASQAASPSLWDKTVSGYQAVSGLMQKPAQWLQQGYSAITEPLRGIIPDQVEPMILPEKLGGALTPGAAGRHVWQGILDKTAPSLAGVHEGAVEMGEQFMGDPTNAVPFGKIPVASKAVAAFFAPGAIGGAVQSLQQAADLIASGADDKQVAKALTNYFGNAAFAYLMTKQLKDGKAPEQIAEETAARIAPEFNEGPPQPIEGQQLQMFPEAKPKSVVKVGSKTARGLEAIEDSTQMEAGLEGAVASNKMQPYDWNQLGMERPQEGVQLNITEPGLEKQGPPTRLDAAKQRLEEAKAKWQSTAEQFKGPKPTGKPTAVFYTDPTPTKGSQVGKAMDFAQDVYKMVRPILPEFVAPGKAPRVEMSTARTEQGGLFGETYPEFANVDDLMAFNDREFTEGELGRGFPDASFRVDMPEHAQSINVIHGAKPVLVQARLFLREVADTVVHEMAHAADLERSTHLEEPSSIPGFTKSERFGLVNDFLQSRAKPMVIELIKAIPDGHAINMYHQALGDTPLDRVTLQHLYDSVGFAPAASAPPSVVGKPSGRVVTPEEQLMALYRAGQARPGGQPPQQLQLDQMIDLIQKNRAGETPIEKRFEDVREFENQSIDEGSFGPETGAISSQMVSDLYKGAKAIPGILWRHTGQLLRASAAGQISTAVTNVTSGGRMALKQTALAPIAAAEAKRQEIFARRRGDTQKADELATSRKYYMSLAKQYGRMLPGELYGTVADMFSFAKGKPVAHGKFDQRLVAMEQMGGKRTAKAIREFSSPEATPDTRLKKILMFFSIAGDRFANRLFLGAQMEALQSALGVKDLNGLIKVGQSTPQMKEFIHRTLEAAGTEAMKAAWNLPWARGAYHGAMKGISDMPGVGLLAAPYGKAMFANFLPNVVEQFPGLHLLSRRVRDSYKYEALRNTMHQLDALKQQMPKGSQNRKNVGAALTKIRQEIRGIEEQGVYDPVMVNVRAMSGMMIMTAAAAIRVLKGDDGTEYDQTEKESDATGKAIKVASWTGTLGEDLPYVMLGDMLGHMVLAKRSGKDTTKYSVKDGLINLSTIPEAFFGSKYGFRNPGLEILTAVTKGGKVKEEYLERLAENVSASLGRMAGAGAWIGQGARKIGEAVSDEEKFYRRTDTEGSVAGAAKAGFQSQMPVLRQQLPKSPSWGEMRNAQVEDPISGMITGANRSIVTPIQRFINDHQGKLDPSDVYPRRTSDPEFDQMRLEAWEQLVKDRVIKKVLGAPKFATLNEDAQIERFRSVMTSVRDASEDLAVRRYRRTKGGVPPHVAREEYDERSKRQAVKGGGAIPKPPTKGPVPRGFFQPSPTPEP